MLQVMVQLDEEKAAVTPAGRADVENVTEPAVPETKAAVIPLDACWPDVTESDGADADSDITVEDGGGGASGAAVVNV